LSLQPQWAGKPAPTLCVNCPLKYYYDTVCSCQW